MKSWYLYPAGDKGHGMKYAFDEYSYLTAENHDNDKKSLAWTTELSPQGLFNVARKILSATIPLVEIYKLDDLMPQVEDAAPLIVDDHVDCIVGKTHEKTSVTWFNNVEDLFVATLSFELFEQEKMPATFADFVRHTGTVAVVEGLAEAWPLAEEFLKNQSLPKPLDFDE